MFLNSKGKHVLFSMVKAIQENKAYLGEVDAGATSCCIILVAMADGILEIL